MRDIELIPRTADRPSHQLARPERTPAPEEKIWERIVDMTRDSMSPSAPSNTVDGTKSPQKASPAVPANSPYYIRPSLTPRLNRRGPRQSVSSDRDAADGRIDEEDLSASPRRDGVTSSLVHSPVAAASGDRFNGSKTLIEQIPSKSAGTPRPSHGDGPRSNPDIAGPVGSDGDAWVARVIAGVEARGRDVDRVVKRLEEKERAKEARDIMRDEREQKRDSRMHELRQHNEALTERIDVLESLVLSLCQVSPTFHIEYVGSEGKDVVGQAALTREKGDDLPLSLTRSDGQAILYKKESSTRKLGQQRPASHNTDVIDPSLSVDVNLPRPMHSLPKRQPFNPTPPHTEGTCVGGEYGDKNRNFGGEARDSLRPTPQRLSQTSSGGAQALAWRQSGRAEASFRSKIRASWLRESTSYRSHRGISSMPLPLIRTSSGASRGVWNSAAALKRLDPVETMDARLADAEDDQELLDDDIWIQNSHNAWGAFIHVAIHHGVVSALLHCGPMCFLSFIVQSVFALYLWLSCPALKDSLFCAIPQPLHMASVGIYLTLMLEGANRMYKAGNVCLFAMEKRCAESDAHIFPVEMSPWTRSFIFVFAVLTNVFTWLSLTVVGIVFIMTQNDVQMVLRSTVVMMFVQNVDQVAFNAGASKQIKAEVVATLYRIRGFSCCGLLSKGRVDNVYHYYSLFGHLPAITAICFAIILAGQRVCAGDDPTVPLHCLSCPSTQEALKTLSATAGRGEGTRAAPASAGSPCTRCGDGTYPADSLDPTAFFVGS